MKPTTTNYILLSLAIPCSFLAIYTFDFYPDDSYNKSLDSLRLLIPGILFSFFIIFIQRSNWTIRRLTSIFFILLLLYSACLIAGLSSWGIAVPFVGGIGAILIRKLFYQNAKLLDKAGKDYLIFGFAAGLGGLFVFFVLQSALQPRLTDGVGFGFILAIWQLVFGILWIERKK